MKTIYISFRQTGRGLTRLRNSNYLFEHNRDARGRFCTTYYTDSCGNIMFVRIPKDK